MDELLTTTPNPADRQVQYSDESFEIAIGPSGTMPPNRDLIYKSWWGVSVTALADSKEAAGVADTFCPIAPVSSVADDPDSGGLFLTAAEAFIRQVQEDLDELPASVRSSHPAELCRRFVEGVGTALAYVPQARCAVFGDEEDGVELVAHSHASMRQVSFEFGLEESLINIVRIDERMHRSVQTCGIDKVRTLAEAIAWLNPH